MTRARLAVASVALLAGSLVAEPSAAPDPATITRLVAQLGDEDFARREAAEAELDRLGAAALESLRAACRSPNPEVARRARDLVGRIGRRVDNEAALAPTLVDLTARDAPLDTVLDDLSAQSDYRVLVGGETVPFVAGRKFTLKTGKVPFWTAVLAVCDAAHLRIASAGGFIAPGSGPPGSAPNPFERRPQPLRRPEQPRRLLARPDPNPSTSVFLEPRGKQPKRPAAVYGAVLVEAVEIPPAAAVEGTAAALLQVWPEPKLNWQATTGVRVKRAADAAGQLLAARTGVPAQAPQVVARNNVVIVKNVQGGVVLVNPGAKVPPPAVGPFTPNARQAVATLAPGPKPAAVLAELSGVVTGSVRSGAEPLAVGELAGEWAAGRPQVEVSGRGGTLLRASVRPLGAHEHVLDVEVGYDPAGVEPSGASGYTPVLRSGFGGGGRDRGAGPAGGSPTTVYGVRVTDADGRPFALTTVQVRQQLDRATGRQGGAVLALRLTPTEKGQTAPKTVTFSGTYLKPVEVPVTLTGVPIAVGGK